VIDLGAHRRIPQDDYPDYAQAIARALQSGKAERGVLICAAESAPASPRTSFPGSEPRCVTIRIPPIKA